MIHYNPLLQNMENGKKFITMGEIMLRLTPPNYEKIRMASGFEASYGGSEANIALALANLGVDSTFFSVVPNNSLGKSAVRWLRSNDVHCTPMILTSPEETPTHRLGTYYLETGYGIRPSKVIYDRKHSAMAEYDFSDVEAPKLKDVKCPLCGGDMVKTPFGYGCANYKKDDPESCRFSVGQIAGVKLKEAQVKELLTNGKTGVIEGFIAKTGMKFDAPLKLTKEGQITFDFPEKPKPVETTVKCPRCGELLKKSQWYYECDCGFRLGHTVAKVPLSEETIKELLKTGKTKEKVTGFTSKAGNVFDACLKYEDERISFDFDNPGSEPLPKQESEEQSEVQTEQTPDSADDFYAAMANEVAAFQEEEETEWIAGSNFLDEFMP